VSSVPVTITAGPPAPADPAALLAEAAGAAKCAACGCAHEASAALVALPAAAPPALHDAARRLATSLTPQRYPCLGCAVCWPAEALSALQGGRLVPEGAACPAEPAVPRPGWPPLAGDYTVLRYGAPVAVCALGDGDLAAAVTAQAGSGVGIVGTLTTENLGIDRLVRNTITNPNLRFVIICGQEVEQRIGHYPGGSLLALAANGTDAKGRIVAAPGRRPRLRNLTAAEVAHFRAHVEVVDLIGTTGATAVLAAAQECAARDPGPAPDPPGGLAVPILQAVPARRTIAGPAGYLVVHADPARRLLVIEHYCNDGLLTAVIEAANATDGYTSVLAAGLVSRLDHAAYLGRELARAEHALRSSTPYRQDAAPG
jgi:tetrahydromethanopterin S-methyltransferase subunit A